MYLLYRIIESRGFVAERAVVRSLILSKALGLSSYWRCDGVGRIIFPYKTKIDNLGNN